MKYILLILGGALVHFLMSLSQEVTRALEVINDLFVAKLVAMEKRRNAAIEEKVRE